MPQSSSAGRAPKKGSSLKVRLWQIVLQKSLWSRRKANTRTIESGQTSICINIANPRLILNQRYSTRCPKSFCNTIGTKRR